MKQLLNFIIGCLSFIFNAARRLLAALYNKFLDINIFEKGIVINSVLAFAAIVVPVAKFFIFGQYYTINNPIAHHLIGIVIIMLVTVYFPGLITMLARLGINILYLAGTVYLHLAGEICKTPYQLTAGYSLNIAAPVIYIALAAASGMLFRDN